MANRHLNGKQETWLRAGLLAAWLALTLFTGYWMVLKHHALAFHDRDLNYFLEFAARASDPELEDRFSFNIEGFNFIGLQEIEAVNGIYQTIHLEPFRWLYSPLYGLTQSANFLFFFFSAVFYLPLLYLLFLRLRLPPDRRPALLTVIVFSLLLFLFPASFHAATEDLRSRMILGSAWVMALAAIWYRRPFPEKLLLLLFLPLLREEGSVLALWLFLLDLAHNADRPAPLWQRITLGLLPVATFIAFLAFMHWGGFDRIDVGHNPLTKFRELIPSLNLRLGLVAGGLVGAAILWFLPPSPLRKPIRFIALYGSLLAAVLLQLKTPLTRFLATLPADNLRAALKIIEWEQLSLPWALLVAPLLFLPAAFWTLRRRRTAYLLCGLLFLLSTANTIVYWSEYRQESRHSQLVWDFTAAHDRLDTPVLVDFNTVQAFYDWKQVLAYNRIPIWMTEDDHSLRHYPQNSAIVAQAIAEGIPWAVIARDSLPEVSELIQLAGRSWTEAQGNEGYLILEIH